MLTAPALQSEHSHYRRTWDVLWLSVRCRDPCRAAVPCCAALLRAACCVQIEAQLREALLLTQAALSDTQQQQGEADGEGEQGEPGGPETREGQGEGAAPEGAAGAGADDDAGAGAHGEVRRWGDGAPRCFFGGGANPSLRMIPSLPPGLSGSLLPGSSAQRLGLEAGGFGLGAGWRVGWRKPGVPPRQSTEALCGSRCRGRSMRRGVLSVRCSVQLGLGGCSVQAWPAGRCMLLLVGGTLTHCTSAMLAKLLRLSCPTPSPPRPPAAAAPPPQWRCPRGRPRPRPSSRRRPQQPAHAPRQPLLP